MCLPSEINCIAAINTRHTNPGSYTSRSSKQINAPGLTLTGRQWLTRALDPFHDDVSVPKAGLPDYSPYATVLKEHNRSIEISKPTAVAEGESWNCAIFTMPNLNNSNYRKVTYNADGSLTYSGVADSIFNGDTVSVVKWPASSGSDWFQPTVDGQFASGAQFAGISLYDNGTTVPSNTLARLIGGGFEVSNTTATLYKQGNLTCAAAPQLMVHTMTPRLNDSNLTRSVGTPMKILRLPPTSLEAVRANPNAVSWPAEHGVYVPFRMDHSKNEYALPEETPLFYKTNVSAGQGLMSSLDVPASTDNDFRFPTLYYKPFLAPIGQQVAMFSGLSSQSTLVLNVRFIEEVAPIADLDLLSFGPELYMADPLAIELYQRALMTLPVAVTFEENYTAEFWSRVVRAVSNIATPLAGQYGGAPAAIIVKAVTKAVTDKLDKKAQEQKSQQVVAAKQIQKIANKK